VRVVRLVRLIRIVKIYKNLQTEDEMEEDDSEYDPITGERIIHKKLT
jgi:hypothetical protein